MKDVFSENKKAFTVIEILLIICIIGILATIILASGMVSGRDKAAINSYKTSMNSVRTAMEMCGDGNRVFANGMLNGSQICIVGESSSVYPKVKGCGDLTFSAGDPGGGFEWMVTTSSDCKGCRLICTIEKCEPSASSNCD